MESNQKPSLFKDLWDRRFPQFFVTYLGAGWALIQFSEWLVRRYSFDNSLVDKLALFLLICLPAFLMYVYNHGRPGPDPWKPIEKVFIPINVLVAAGISFLAISPSAAPKTEVVSIQNEEGDTITRIVPTAAYSKRIVSFPFENLTKDPKNDWKRFGIPVLLDKDLEQDMRVFSINPISLYDDYNSIDKDYNKEIPFSSKLKIAQDNYADLLIEGKFNETGEGFLLNAEAFDASTGKSFYKKSYTSDTYYGAVDDFTTDLMDALYLEEFETGEAILDLPSRDLITGDNEALENFIKGTIYLTENIIQPQGGLKYFQTSVEKDPDCAECFHSLGLVQSRLLDPKASLASLKKAVDLSYSLPERQKLGIQQHFYGVNQEPDKMIMLLETWTKLYPSDVNPYITLLELYALTQEIDKAKDVGKKALNNGHKGSIYKKLANIHLSTGDLEKSEELLETFSELYPHKANEIAQLADVYQKKGNVDKAKAHLLKINLLKPNDIQSIVKLGQLEEFMGNFDNAVDRYDEALERSTKTLDSVKVYQAYEKFYERKGQIAKEIEMHDKRFAMMKTYIPEIQVDLKKLELGYRYPLIGKESELLEFTDTMVEKYKHVNPNFECLFRLMYYMNVADSANYRVLYDQCGEFIRKSSGANSEYLMEAMYMNMTDNYEAAANLFKQFIDSTGIPQIQFGHMISEVFRKADRIDEARDYIDLVLKEDPTQAIYLLELARVEQAEGNTAKAKKTIEKALEYWSEADSNYKYMLQAQEFQKSL